MLWPISPDRAVMLPDGVVEPGLLTPRPAGTGDPDPVEGTIVPAFSDWHFHWVQLGLPPADGKRLLTWLRESAWPAEERFSDVHHAAAEAPAAIERLYAAGTVAGAAYGSPHVESADAFLRAAPPSFICGPALMTDGEPDALRQPLPHAVAGLRRLVTRHPRRTVVSPRFGPSVRPEAMAALGQFARSAGLFIQAHLAETPDEIVQALGLHPDAGDYTAIYENAGLIGSRTLLGHAIHVSDDELRRIAAARGIVVHCPSSNGALGSGRMPLERLRAAGVRWVLGSDVGAGPSLCMLDAVSAALEVHDGHAELTAVEALHRATVGPAGLFSGSEGRRLRRLGDRPGALVIETPDVELSERDPEVWIRSWVDRWRATGDAGIIRTANWDRRGDVRHSVGPTA